MLRVYEQSAQENLERTYAVLPLTFVNMDPSKLSTMYTCILLAAEQRKKCGWYCTTIKFDIPLEKTREMVLVERQLTLLSGVNIRLGAFPYCFRTDITMEQVLMCSWTQPVV